VTLDDQSGLITRVDGFFGHPTSVGPDTTIPTALLRGTPVA
jgi:hypothetical protein